MKINIVVLNPSLGKTAILRDRLFLRVAKLLNRKVIVFFHGWDKTYENIIDRNPMKHLSTYMKADMFLVLSSEFKFKLLSWGVTSDIYLTTTKVDDSLLNGFDIKQRDFKQIKFLFLSRIVENKGVFEALNAFKQLNDSPGKYSLTIVGDGPSLKDAIKYVSDNSIFGVTFKGRLDGQKLADEFILNNIYLFPSYHGEGMPTSVLEAMAFGMPIVTTRNAGLKDFFLEDNMGGFCDMRSSDSLYSQVDELIKSKDLYQTSQFNYNFAKKQFLASQVAPKLESIFLSVF